MSRLPVEQYHSESAATMDNPQFGDYILWHLTNKVAW